MLQSHSMFNFVVQGWAGQASATSSYFLIALPVLYCDSLPLLLLLFLSYLLSHFMGAICYFFVGL